MFNRGFSREGRSGHVYLRELPGFLLSGEALESLGRLLLEFNDLRSKLPPGIPGERINDYKQARRMLDDVMKTVLDLLTVDENSIPAPDVDLDRGLNSLRNKTAALGLLYIPVAALFLILTFAVQESDSAVWAARAAASFLLAAPFLIVRRTRIHMEHQSGYARNRRHRPAVVVPQLPSTQFQSYLSYGYACHLYYYLVRHEGRKEMRQGWARLVQWKTAEELYRRDGNAAHLAFPLDQIIGELKFIYTLTSKALGRPVPPKVRSIRTMYVRNPLVRLLAGWPGFAATNLVEHGIGTAVYFLSDRREPVWRPITTEVFEKESNA